jgi:hypothetical protein
MLAGGLPGDTELGGDLWPPDAELDGVVDQRYEFGLCLLLYNAGARSAPAPAMGTSGNLLWHTGCFAGAWCDRSGRPLLALELEWRFGFPMRSSMGQVMTIQGRYDQSVGVCIQRALAAQ